MSESKKQDLTPLLKKQDLTLLHLTSFYIKFDSEEKRIFLQLYSKAVCSVNGQDSRCCPQKDPGYWLELI